MSILSTPLPHGFSLLTQSMIQASDLPLSEVLDCSIIANAFEDDSIDFGKADEDVFTPAITLWAMVSQMLSSGTARSCKVAAGRVVSLIAQTTGRIVSQNAGNYCRAKAKIYGCDDATGSRSLSWSLAWLDLSRSPDGGT